MSCCGASPNYEEIDEVSRLVSAKLAAFLKTLRDNGFARRPARRPGRGRFDGGGLCRKARPVAYRRSNTCSRRGNPTGTGSTGCSTRSGSASGCRSRSITTGSAKAGQQSVAEEPAGLQIRNAAGSEAATDQIPSADEALQDRSGEGRMEGASRAENLAEVDFRKLADPEQIEQAHAAAARLGKDHAHAADAARPGAAARLPARSPANDP